MADRFRYTWEVFPVGRVRETRRIAIKREECVAFAKQFDPQPFHVEVVLRMEGAGFILRREPG